MSWCTWSTSLNGYIRNAPSDTEVHTEHQLRVDRSTWQMEQHMQNHTKKNSNEALRLWSGSTDSKTPDYQKINPREYQIVKTHTKETTWIQDPARPATSSTLCRMPHPNKNKTKIQTQSLSDRINTSLSLAHQRKNKENSPPLTRSTTCTLHEAYTNHWTNLMRTKTKRKKEFNLKAWEKETSTQ